jgi:hypothetical protein
MRFCFTGPAIVNGMHIERKYLIDLAVEKGHVVQSKVDTTTDFLVRGTLKIPTIKSQTASKMVWNGHKVGKTAPKVISPEDFLKKMGYL